MTILLILSVVIVAGFLFLFMSTRKIIKQKNNLEKEEK